MKEEIGLKHFKDKVKGCRLGLVFKELRYELKLAWQRAWRGYDDIFCWNMDSVFVEVFYKLLDNLIKNGMSHPYQMTPEEWNNTLIEMRDLLFEADYWGREDYFELTPGDWKEIEQSKDKFFELFSKYFYDLWD